MALNIEAEANIKYTDESGTYHFFVGDEVMCATRLKQYVGEISFIGLWHEKEGAEDPQVICLDISNGSTSHSKEIIKLKDITFIRKNPFVDEMQPFGENEEFIKSLVDKGFSQDKARIVSDGMNAAAVLYTTSLSKVPAYVVKAVDNIENGEMSGEELKDAVMDNAKECAAVAVKEYIDLLKMFIRKIGREEKHGLRFSDVINIVSKCWDDLAEQDLGRIAEMADKLKQ